MFGSNFGYRAWSPRGYLGAGIGYPYYGYLGGGYPYGGYPYGGYPGWGFYNTPYLPLI